MHFASATLSLQHIPAGGKPSAWRNTCPSTLRSPQRRGLHPRPPFFAPPDHLPRFQGLLQAQARRWFQRQTASLQGLLSEYFTCSLGSFFCHGSIQLAVSASGHGSACFPDASSWLPGTLQGSALKVNSSASPEPLLCLGFPSHGRPIIAQSQKPRYCPPFLSLHNSNPLGHQDLGVSSSVSSDPAASGPLPGCHRLPLGDCFGTASR